MRKKLAVKKPVKPKKKVQSSPSKDLFFSKEAISEYRKVDDLARSIIKTNNYCFASSFHVQGSHARVLLEVIRSYYSGIAAVDDMVITMDDGLIPLCEDPKATELKFAFLTTFRNGNSWTPPMNRYVTSVVVDGVEHKCDKLLKNAMKGTGQEIIYDANTTSRIGMIMFMNHRRNVYSDVDFSNTFKSDALKDAENVSEYIVMLDEAGIKHSHTPETVTTNKTAQKEIRNRLIVKRAERGVTPQAYFGGSGEDWVKKKLKSYYTMGR